MNHKHIAVVIEDLMYSGTIDTDDAINDLANYVECVEKGDAESHYKQCINK